MWKGKKCKMELKLCVLLLKNAEYIVIGVNESETAQSLMLKIREQASKNGFFICKTPRTTFSTKDTTTETETIMLSANEVVGLYFKSDEECNAIL